MTSRVSQHRLHGVKTIHTMSPSTGPVFPPLDTLPHSLISSREITARWTIGQMSSHHAKSCESRDLLRESPREAAPLVSYGAMSECSSAIPERTFKRMKGFEPSTFAMARRRSSQLSYIRVSAHSSPRRPWTPARHARAPAAYPLKVERPTSPKGSSRSRTASRKPFSAASRWKACPSAVWRVIPSKTVPSTWVACRPWA
jgi:hypothetical protein